MLTRRTMMLATAAIAVAAPHSKRTPVIQFRLLDQVSGRHSEWAPVSVQPPDCFTIAVPQGNPPFIELRRV